MTAQEAYDAAYNVAGLTNYIITFDIKLVETQTTRTD